MGKLISNGVTRSTLNTQNIHYGCKFVQWVHLNSNKNIVLKINALWLTKNFMETCYNSCDCNILHHFCTMSVHVPYYIIVCTFHAVVYVKTIHRGSYMSAHGLLN